MKWQYCRIARTQSPLGQESLVFEHYGLTEPYDFSNKPVPEIVGTLLTDGWEPLGGLEFKRMSEPPPNRLSFLPAIGSDGFE